MICGRWQLMHRVCVYLFCPCRGGVGGGAGPGGMSNIFKIGKSNAKLMDKEKVGTAIVACLFVCAVSLSPSQLFSVCC